jgi:hypothetical protein
LVLLHIMAKENDKKEEVAAEKSAPKFKGSEEVILVDENGNETSTTKAFYESNIEAFKTSGVKPKK